MTMPGIESYNPFKSEYEKYVQYNFHRLDYVEQALEVILDNEDKLPRVLVLAGEPGIGREYFVKSLAHVAAAQKRGIRLKYGSIDLDGYELAGARSLEHYAIHQIRKSSAPDKSLLRKIADEAQLIVKGGVGISKYAFVSLALSLKLPIAKLRGIAKELSGPPRKPREALWKLIESVTKEGKFILHVKDNDQLTATFRRWLLDDAKCHRSLIIAFSCHSIDDFTKTVEGVDYLPLEIEPHNQHESHFVDVINARFSPNVFPDAFRAVLWRYSRGRPADLAIKLRDLVKAGLIRHNYENGWYLKDESLQSKAFVSEFAADFYEPIDRLKERLPSETMATIEEFLPLAAMCGKYVPAELLLEYMGLSKEERTKLIDVIDENLVENRESCLFEDYEYMHPGFKDISIYAFKNRTLRKAILERASKEEQASLASKLLGFLKANLPVESRAIARLFTELARCANIKREREYFELGLAWWIGTDEAEDLKQGLIEAVKNHQLRPEVLWNVVSATKDRWPPYRRFAILEAYAKQPGGVPYTMLDEFYNAKYILLHDLAYYNEAEEIAKSLLEMRQKTLGPEHTGTAAVMNGLGLILHQLGRYGEAESLYRRALEIDEASYGKDPPKVATVLNNLAGLLYNTDRLKEAEPLYRRALEIDEASYGKDHPKVAIRLNNLASLLQATNRLKEAEPMMKRALNIDEASFGKYHPKVGIPLNNLAQLYQDTGRLKEAEPLYKRVVTIFEKSLGPDHPNVATALNNLALLYHATNRLKEAEPLMKRHLVIFLQFTRRTGTPHPHLEAAINNYGDLLRQMGCSKDQIAARLKRLAPEMFQ